MSDDSLRLRRIAVSFSFFEGLLKRHGVDVPHDLDIRRAYIVPDEEGIQLVVSSKAFQELPVGAIIPPWTPTIIVEPCCTHQRPGDEGDDPYDG